MNRSVGESRDQIGGAKADEGFAEPPDSEPPRVERGETALRFSGVSKSYPGVRALDDVSLEVRAGEVHGLVGENGAGKSTLMAIAAGSLAADAGHVDIGGVRLERASADAARELGLAIVYQHPALLPDLTIAENLALGVSPRQRPSWGRAEGWATEALATWARNRTIDPALPVRELGPDVRFMVEISKALSQRPQVLLLDEPTEHLAGDDLLILFEQVKSLAASGTAVVYISHRIPEVMQISDRISVLRDGVLQGTARTADMTVGEIVTKIVGRPLETAFPPKRDDGDGAVPALSVHDLRGARFADFNLDVLPGEIVGLAGVEGNGQREVVRALAGLIPAHGSVRVGSDTVRLGTNSGAAAAGLAYIPPDRHAEGMLPRLGVRENVAIKSVGRYSRAGVVSGRLERRAIKDRVDQLRVKAPSLETRVEALSGGNQQKVILGRILESRPKVILADEPTQGVDVGARLEIYRFLRAAVAEGSGAIVVSSDGAELEGLCDRVLVLSRGRIVRELTGDEVTEQQMTEAALTSTTSRGEAPVTKSGMPWLKRFLGSDLAPAAILAVVILALGAYTANDNEFYLSELNFTGLLTLFAALAFVSLAQQVVMIGGGIDLSVGPLTGFLVVVASFVIVTGSSGIELALGWILLLAIALGVGFFNWAPTLFGIPPFLTTLVTFTALQGLSLLLRPEAGGEIHEDVISAISTNIGFVPVMAIVAVVVALALEYALRRTTWGVALRAVGSNDEAAREVGVRTHFIRLSSYLAAGILVFGACLLLMAQVGSGDANAGTNYTLISIAAVVLGGASIFGGRGSFVGALLGALLIQQINTATVFLNVDLAWQTYLLGILTLLAAGVYSRARDVGAHA